MIRLTDQDLARDPVREGLAPQPPFGGDGSEARDSNRSDPSDDSRSLATQARSHPRDSTVAQEVRLNEGANTVPVYRRGAGCGIVSTVAIATWVFLRRAPTGLSQLAGTEIASRGRRPARRKTMRSTRRLQGPQGNAQGTARTRTNAVPSCLRPSALPHFGNGQRRRLVDRSSNPSIAITRASRIPVSHWQQARSQPPPGAHSSGPP